MTSRLKALIRAGKYPEALQSFKRLKRPTAEDWRLAAEGHLALREFVQVKQAAMTAVAHGQPTARLELAICARMEGNLSEARTLLATLGGDALQPDDAAYVLREQAILEEAAGSLQNAQCLLQRALEQAVLAAPTTQSAVAHSAGLLAERLGESRKALEYFALALPAARGERKNLLHLALGRCALYLGQWTEAKEHFDKSEDSALRSYYLGLLKKAQGELPLAQAAIQSALKQAREQQRPELECYCALAVAGIATSRDDFILARELLRRAEFLSCTETTLAHLHWRRGSFQLAQHERAGLTELQQALLHFEQEKQTREALWVMLHLAEGHLALGEPQLAQQVLIRSADRFAACGKELSLAMEWPILPLTTAWLEEQPAGEYVRLLHPSAATTQRSILMQTLRGSAIFVDGKRVKLQLRRTVEVLMYFLQVREATLQQVQAALFPDDSPQQSKNYFHQVRSEVKRLVPGVTLSFDEGKLTYLLALDGVQLETDLDPLLSALNEGHEEAILTTTFNFQDYLMECDSSWVEAERARMTRWIIRVGLEAMDDWARQGEFIKCLQLSERLLEIEPLDEGLHDFLIRATTEVHGPAAGRARCMESQRKFIEDVGSAPQWLFERLNDLFSKHLN